MELSKFHLVVVLHVFDNFMFKHANKTISHETCANISKTEI